MKPVTTRNSSRFNNDKKVVSGLNKADQLVILEKLKLHRASYGRQSQNEYEAYSSSSFRNSRQSLVLKQMKGMSVLPDDLSESEEDTDTEQIRQNLARCGCDFGGVIITRKAQGTNQVLRRLGASLTSTALLPIERTRPGRRLPQAAHP